MKKLYNADLLLFLCRQIIIRSGYTLCAPSVA